MIPAMIPQFPLLRRELTELANRPRTYVIRVAGAVILLSIVYLQLRASIYRSTGAQTAGMPGSSVDPSTATAAAALNLLGIGGEIFEEIVPWLFRLIQILMPALCCGAITMEKERNTLGTLFLTRLSPSGIILEKLASRLVPMFTFLLLTFPVLAYVYSLGGVDTSLLAGTIWLLFCECLLYASIALMFSSWYTTTVAAFIASYVVVALLVARSTALAGLSFTPWDLWRYSFTGNTTVRVMQGLFPGPGEWFSAVLVLVVATLPSLILTSFCLIMARVFLFRRAFSSSSSWVLKAFRVVDRFFVSVNNRAARGIVIVRDVNSLPEFDPICWRERTRKSLGKARYLFRVLTLIEVPILSICTIAALQGARGSGGLWALLFVVWMLAALVIVVRASTTISGERARETLEALLSTPMSASQILSEKVAGMSRLMIVMSIPILTVNATQFLMSIGGTNLLQEVLQNAGLATVYGLFCLAGTWLTMQTLAWVSAGIGMRFHSQSKSVVVSIAGVAALTVIPFLFMAIVLARLPEGTLSISRGTLVDRQAEALAERIIRWMLNFAFTPGGTIILSEYYLDAVGNNGAYWRQRGQWAGINAEMLVNLSFSLTILGLVLQSAMLFLVRRLVLRWAPALLNRQEQRDVISAGASVAHDSLPPQNLSDPVQAAL
ncbi:MAG: hypothetical protein ACK526_17780 [Planctomyces sp.]